MKKAKTASILLLPILVYIVFFQMNNVVNFLDSVALSFVSLDEVLEKREDFLNNLEKNKKKNTKNIHNRYAKRNKAEPIKILIVPGHDDEFSGTEYEGVREVDLNRKVAKRLYDLLKDEFGIEVVLASDENGYQNELRNYFDKERDSIQKFISESKASFQKKVLNGEFNLDNKNFHNYAPGEVAHRLYGINQWVNQEDFDLVLHIHLNDYSGRRKNPIPKYNGFAIYIPDRQFGNYELSKELADNILERLNDFVAVSNLPPESMGVVEDNELIAVGANETLAAGVVLIEYGYIYEKQYTHPDLSDFVLGEVARLTYMGIKDMFGEEIKESPSEYVYKKDLSQSVVRSDDNLKLQYQLSKLGKYPPKGKGLGECPIAGYFGECTIEAVKEFQRENGLPETGYVGDKTRDVLNNFRK